jgi:hypothetical protein
MTEWNPTGEEEAAYERGWAHAKAWWQPERDIEIINALKDRPEFLPVIDLINAASVTVSLRS